MRSVDKQSGDYIDSPKLPDNILEDDERSILVKSTTLLLKSWVSFDPIPVELGARVSSEHGSSDSIT